LAHKYYHFFTLADVLAYSGCQHSRLRQDANTLLRLADELIQLSKEMGFIGWHAAANCYRGEALVMLGRIPKGIQLLEEGYATYLRLGTMLHLPAILSTLANGYASFGNLSEAWSVLKTAFEFLERSDERHWEPDIRRVKAGFHIMQGEDDLAEMELLESIEIARRTGARSWELRSAIDLAQLWKKQSRLDEAQKVLSGVYSWFTEGFNTLDLVNAKALLNSITKTV
jgi:predicted ATPase